MRPGLRMPVTERHTAAFLDDGGGHAESGYARAVDSDINRHVPMSSRS